MHIMVTHAKSGSDGALAAPPDDLCLEFANTLFWRGSDPPTEQLHGPVDLLAWAEGSGGAPRSVVKACRARWRAHPGDAGGAFAAAIDLRETIQRLFAAVTGQEPPAVADLAAFNRWLEAAPARSRLRRIEDGFGWDVGAATVAQRADAVIPVLLARVLWSAADLLTGPRRVRVRRCANDRCLWLFLDDSKSGNRRWCSMSACGNRAKAHRHYIKHRHAG